MALPPVAESAEEVVMASYAGPIIDVDVHHRPKSNAEFVEFMPRQWREYVRGDGHGPLPLEPPSANAFITPFEARRADAFGDDGSFPGSSFEKLRDQVLDRYGYHRAILTHDLGQYPTLLNPYFAQAVCRAVNDWNLATWLTYDDRLYSLAVVPLGNPEQAVEELYRVGRHDRIVGLLICGNPLGKPLGDAIFDPVWKACADLGLVVSLHPISADRPNSQMTSTGGPKAYPEAQSQFSQQAQHYISSLVVHGTFEKFPDLRFVVKEYGVAWLPYVMWRLDQNYEVLRHESPWLKKWPSEYIRSHIKLSTQPLEESPDGKGVVADFLATVDGIEDLLCFSTDYPHYSMDDPTYVARLLPSGWHRKVFCENACASYGWEVPAQASKSGPAVAARTG
jgi:predicted TIM-barrel fold metal-dependent hydrolase